MKKIAISLVPKFVLGTLKRYEEQSSLYYGLTSKLRNELLHIVTKELVFYLASSRS